MVWAREIILAGRKIRRSAIQKWWWTFPTAACIGLTAGTADCRAQAAPPAPAPSAIQIVELQGGVEVLHAGTTAWTPAQDHQDLHPSDRIHTAANSRVALRWSDQSVVSFGASTELEILPPDAPDAQSGLHLIRGLLSFFHRDQPGRIRIITRGAVAGVEGTEFVLAVNDADATTLSVVDGKVKFGNASATLSLTNGQQATAELGQAPARTPGFIANNLLQWCFYYPAVLDPDELPLTADEQKNLADSLAAYRSGDLLAALAKFPAGNSDTDAVKVYHAALLLAVGEVEKTEAVLAALPKNSERTQRLAGALRQLIAAVKRQPAVMTAPPQLASELLAQSYFEQSRAVRETSLANALALAESAARLSPKFGFAWEHVAELDFSFGRTADALTALDTSLALAPRNAQALALKGFILAAQNSPRAAIASFDAALAADSALANAWLGRGLSRIRLRDTKGGREDLLVAAALEPQRAELRSYLGKAYIAAGDDAHATKELDLAKKLDPKDPTAWLYSALQKQQDNQINAAIRDLETSEQLNNNRSVYRSQLLLDQDQAVRAADLAGIYADAGMTDVSTREAGRAVSYDYANYSAHLFLANSYDQLRDPNWSNLRYETPAVSEFWIANLLAPGSAGALTPLTAQQSYTELFDQNRVGVVSDTTYLSRGAWAQSGAQFGTYDNFSYNFQADYTSDPGQRPNNDNEQRALTLTVKDQFTSQDSAFFTVQQAQINSGDVNEYYNPANASDNFQRSETQQPNLFLGYHHEWGPGSHTLFFASKQTAYESASATNVLQYLGWIGNGHYTSVDWMGNYLNAQLNTELYSTELQQIFESPDHTTIVGTRYQWGDVHYQNAEGVSEPLTGVEGILFPNPFAYPIQNDTLNFYHWNAYGYHTWQIVDSFSVTVGLDYDWLRAPQNVTSAPFSPEEKTTVQFSPKAGFIWQPADQTTFRAVYARSLSGFLNGQSTRIEPTEVAGFNEAYRSLIPEAVAGDTSGSQFDTFDAALEQKFATGTYLSLGGQILYDHTDKVQGAYIYNGDLSSGSNLYPTYTTGLKQDMDFHEYSLLFTADQLLGRQWSVGTRYQLSQASLNLNYPDLNTPYMANNYTSLQLHQNLNSVLNTVNLHANWNHPSGLFGIFTADWNNQHNSSFSPAEPGDDFWQCNAYAGYRMWHRRVEFTIGLLNIFDQNYHLEPLNLYNETARSRTFLARLRVNF